MRFFFDRCVPIAIARMIAGLELGNMVIRHHDEDERFSPLTKDVEWITTLAADGDPTWFVVSGDGRILKNKVEKQALRETGLPFFCLVRPWPETPINEYAWKFVKVWPTILEAARHGDGQVYKVSGGSSLKVEKEW
jgi:hypothetical protein